MPYIRMKRIYLQGLLWLYLLIEFGYMALSLEPGFLDFDNLPDTNFSCLGKVIGGYYADLETNCQMFHVCTIGQLDEPMDIRFLCLNGTVFDQETRVCERIDEVDCSKSEQFYGLNLELYGNTQPPILEDSPETDQPLIIKSTTTTTSTTTSKPKTTNTPFFTSAKPPTLTTQSIGPHHYPVSNSPDIRFNPEEINISLHPGAPPDIRTKPTTFQQQSYSDNNKKVVVTTHSENSDSKKVSVTTHSEVFDEGKVLPSEDFGERPQTQTPRTQKPHHSYGHSNSQTNKNFHPTPSDINYEFTFRQTEPSLQDYHTDSFFHSDFHSDQDYAGHHHNPQSQQFKSSTFLDDFTPTTKGANNFQQKVPTTVRNYFLQSLKPPPPNQPHHYTQHQTEKPQRVQLPLPLLPTLPPLTFSSPAPFALQHHIDTKRYTKDHPSPPRIVISASASVSDASGRRLNYSLGTIGAAEFLEQPPQSYDEYKDEDVGLDPFYHDVPKLKRARSKREANQHTDIIRNEEDAINVLKFLFDWYKNNEKTTTELTTVPTIISTTKAPEVGKSANKANQENTFKNSELFNRNSKFNIIGQVSEERNVQERRSTDAVTKQQTKMSTTTSKTTTTTKTTTTAKTTTTTEMSKYEKDFLEELFGPEGDYVNDNFEPIAYNQKYEEKKQNHNKLTTTVPPEKVKNNSLPKDYVDDNVEPIYFRDRIETNVTDEKKVLTNSEDETKIQLNEKIKKTEDISPSINSYLTSKIIELKPTEKSKQSLVTNTQLKLETSNTVKDTLTEIGDTETNDIKQNIQKENKFDKLPRSFETGGFSEPKSEILETVTTEKMTTSVKPRSNNRRGRKRYHSTNEHEKDSDKKNVVLEKITERAHTAKDDFNYLRTLYKVYTTTPTSNLFEPKSLEEIGPTKVQRVVNDYIDVKEASPSDKIIRTLEENDEHAIQEITSELPHLIPIITTQPTTSTSERTLPLNTITTERISTSSPPNEDIEASGNTTTEQSIPSFVSERTVSSSSTTTEHFTSPSTATSEKTPWRISENTPLSITTTEHMALLSTTSEMITSSSTTTTEKIVPSRPTTSEHIIPPSTTTTENIVALTTTIPEEIISLITTTTEKIIPSSTTTTDNIISSITSTKETTIPTSITTTERITVSNVIGETSIYSNANVTETNISPRRDSRRRGRTRHGDDSSRSRFDNRNHRRKKPEGFHEGSGISKSRSEKNESNILSGITHTSSTTEENNADRKKAQRKDLTEENRLSNNRNIVSYPITTEHIPTVPNNVLLGGATEQIEFLTQLTLNYKKIFEDIIQTSGQIAPQVSDTSTLTVTEADGNIISVSAKSLEEYREVEQVSQDILTEQSNIKDLLLPTTTPLNIVNTEANIIETTIKPEIMTPFTQLKSESQVLQSQETSTLGKSIKGTEYFNTKTRESLEVIPTTLIVTEKSIDDEVIQKTTSPTIEQIPNKYIDTTETLKDETKSIENTVRTVSISDNVINLENTGPTTENTIYEPEGTKIDSIHDRIGNYPAPELTTIGFSQEKTYQTTLSPNKDSTSLIPRITEIFNFYDVSKEKEIFGIPTTLLTTEQTVKSADVVSTLKLQEKNIDISTAIPRFDSTETYQNLNEYNVLRTKTFAQENLSTEDYPSTIFVVRTTENSQKDHEEKNQEINKSKIAENVEQTESYPRTVLVIRTTESPTVSEYKEEEKISILRQLSTQNLQKLIEEIEGNTNSVVATTNIPVMTTDSKNTVTTTEKINLDNYQDVKNVIATTERRHDLQELTSLFQYPASSSYVTTTPVNAVLTPQEEVSESSTLPSTTKVSHIHQETPTTSSITITDPEQMSTSQIERLTISERPLRTTPTAITTTAMNRRGNIRRGGRPTGRRNIEARRGAARHRFSTESFTKRPEGRKQTVEEEILNELTKSSSSATTESYRRRLRVRPNSNRVRGSSTDAPLQKSASPTQPERVKESLPTTPISKEANGKRLFIFNCFGKEMDKFYPDPRDCRLFHYCTQGYNKNQLIDMKFVCDLNTYFDDVKLICSNRKPRRCL